MFVFFSVIQRAPGGLTGRVCFEQRVESMRRLAQQILFYSPEMGQQMDLHNSWPTEQVIEILL
jgi:hypothetical protein